MIGYNHIEFVSAKYVAHKLCRPFRRELNPNLYQSGGGASEVHMIKLIAANQKPLVLWCPNLVTFSFYPWGTFWSNFSRSDWSGGAAALFSSRHPKHFENEKIFLCLKIAEIDMRGQFWVEKNDSGHGNSFFKVKPVLRQKSPCIMCVQYIGRCSVHRGVFSTSGGYHEYIGGCSVHRGISWWMWGIPWVHRGMFSTSEGYHDYIGGISSVHRGMFSTSEGYHDTCGGATW